MSEAQTPNNQHDPQISSAFGPIESLLKSRVLDPPARPGLLASLDRFEIIKLIGAGGMAAVALGRDPAADRLVAIKILKPEFLNQPYATHCFLKEARHMQKMDHPNILKVLEVSDRAAGPYFVMPYVESGSMANLIHSGKPLRREVVLQLARQVAEALGYAHARGIIHHDLKPGNVLVDAELNAYLADFGLLRTVFNDSVVDITRVHCEGTAPYMSPAAAAGKIEDTRSDIYSFGAMLYEMLTGRYPYYGGQSQAIIGRVLAGPPEPITKLNPRAPADLVTVANGAMARQLRDRYAHVADIIDDLERIEKGLAPVGPHGRPSTRLKALASRKSLGFLAAGALAIIAAVLSSVFAVEPSEPGLTLKKELELPGVYNWSTTKLGNWNADAQPELFTLYGNQIFIFSAEGQLIRHYNGSDSGRKVSYLGLLTDSNSDGRDELFVNHHLSTNAPGISVYNQNLYELQSFTTQGCTRKDSRGVPWPSSFGNLVLADLEGDGRRELVAVVATGYGLSPRGVCSFDYESGNLLWCYLSATLPQTPCLLDMNDNGKLDILFGSSAPANGNETPDGTDDAHAYLYAVANNGDPLWRRELAGAFCVVYPLVDDLDDDGEEDIVAWVNSQYAYRSIAAPDFGVIMRFDKAGKTIAEYDVGVEVQSCFAADIDADSKKEILATDRLGYIHVLDESLNRKRKIKIMDEEYPTVDLRIHAIADLDADGTKEIVLSAAGFQIVDNTNPGFPDRAPSVFFMAKPRVLVLSNELQPLCSYFVAEKWQKNPHHSVIVADIDDDGKPEILSLADRAFILEYTPGSIKPE